MRTEFSRDSDGTEYWIAEYGELRGCKTDGATEGEAVVNLHQLFDEYVEARIEENLDIPEPAPLPALEQGVLWIAAPRTIQFPGLPALNVQATDKTAAETEFKDIPMSAV
jgi:predicted RNase H-like HicB family nuclease